MSTRVEARVPRGMRDILPEQMIKRQYVMDVVSQVFQKFGFEPLQTPAIELYETLMGKYGPEAEKLIYQTFHEGGSEELALRYDLSVPLSRLVGMHPQLAMPFKRYHIAPVWRAERPQRGRYREFYQCDCDTVGSSSMLSDAETINVIYAILERLGFTEFSIHINHRKVLNGIGQFAGVPEEQLAGLYRSIDKLDKIGLQGVKKELADNRIPEPAVDRLLDLLQTEGRNRELIDNLEEPLGGLEEARQGLQDLEQILDYLEALGVPEEFYTVKFAMVRGLEYYTGSIYETTVRQSKITSSVTGGGRYDKLIGMFREESLPAVGTTIGIERIIDIMEELDMFPSQVGDTVVEVLVTLFGPEQAKASLSMADRLRQAGINTELYSLDYSLRSQFKYANRKNIPYVVVIGPDEAEQQRATVRDFVSGEQKTVARSQAAQQIKEWMEEDKKS
ncbi:MAG TPA: histidine--tRNA ligase [Acidobacteriota bacterium]|nr:histidine--tRNA ligase [Acidobacteriota bacterium]